MGSGIQGMSLTMENKSPKISVVVLTKNEEKDLRGCLQSLAWSDDIHVFDSFSTDRTIDIANEFGVNVVQRRFDNWSTHQNWGLRNINFKYPWVYYSDADERVTPELVLAMKQATENADVEVAFRVCRRDYLDGRWLKHVTPSPFNIRLFKPSSVSYERLTNPVTVVDGVIGDISAHFNHYPFSKGISHWVKKHNNYSTLEANQIIQNNNNSATFSVSKAFFCSDRNERRFHQKELYYRLPFRPLLMFILLYFVKLGFLDGRAGLKFVILRSIYEYFIVLKVRELKDNSPSSGR